MRRRRFLAVAGLVALAALPALAQVQIEMLPAEQAQQHGTRVSEVIKQQFPNGPIAVDLDAARTTAYRIADQAGVLFIPQKGLSKDVIANAGEQAVPVGVLVLRNVLPVAQGKVVDATKVLEINAGQADGKIFLFYLAARKEGNGRVLAAYSREKTALLATPLREQAGNGAHAIAAKFVNIDEASGRGDVQIALVGAFEATVTGQYVGN